MFSTRTHLPVGTHTYIYFQIAGQSSACQIAGQFPASSRIPPPLQHQTLLHFNVFLVTAKSFYVASFEVVTAVLWTPFFWGLKLHQRVIGSRRFGKSRVNLQGYGRLL
jgi:hypothetical protein